METRMDFVGEYFHSLDAKNRVFIPAKYREYLSGGFVLCKSPDKCLYIYSKEEWEEVAAQVKSLPGTENFRRYKRDFFKNADIVDMDKQGRFTIKAELVDYAQLTKDIVIAGSGNKFEIWNAEQYNDDCGKTLSADELGIEVVF